uniref:Neugrin n=1 Tax=Petromyzon marinus TaxID=7757 RepID=A0AAJ7XHJ5_PETMA|nr:neugrin [Petromyzon marinus]
MEAAVRLAFRGCAVWALRRLPCRLAGFPSPSPGPGQGPPGRESRRGRGPPPVFRPQPSAWLHASSPGFGGPGRGAGRRGPRGGGGGGEEEGDEEEEDEEGDVGRMDPDEEMYRFLRSHRKAVREHGMRRHFDPGPPERRLTWEAMEHMRFLAQECPGEWSVPRLAVGFGVPRSVVVRVLRGRFAPPDARRAKQDAAAAAAAAAAALANAPPGRLPSAGELERLADEHSRRPLAPPETRQAGRDVLDHRGNFLYRI